MEKSDQDKKNLKTEPKVIGVLSGKGGVGKSTLTAEIAKMFKSRGLNVGVLDGDLYGPSIKTLLPDETPPRIEEEKVVPAISQGISVISAAHFPSQKAPVGVRAPIANQIIAQFIEEVEWGPLDVLLVDFPPGTGDIQITLMQKLSFHGVFVVTTPQELSLIDVEKAIVMTQQMGIPLLGIIENMSYFVDSVGKRHYPFGRDGGNRLARRYSLPLLAEVPIGPIQLKNLDLFLGEEKGCKIMGEDPYHFSILWWDGKKSLYRYATLQSHCPCIECKELKKTVDEEIEGLEIIMIGKYGMQCRFSKGCSKGIYPFSLLRALDR